MIDFHAHLDFYPNPQATARECVARNLNAHERQLVLQMLQSYRASVASFASTVVRLVPGGTARFGPPR